MEDELPPLRRLDRRIDVERETVGFDLLEVDSVSRLGRLVLDAGFARPDVQATAVLADELRGALVCFDGRHGYRSTPGGAAPVLPDMVRSEAMSSRVQGRWRSMIVQVVAAPADSSMLTSTPASR